MHERTWHLQSDGLPNGDHQTISDLYTFAVGEASTPTPKPELTPDPTEMPRTFELVDNQYTSQAEVSGWLVYKQGDEVFPAEGFVIQTYAVVYNEKTLSQSGSVQTGQDGAFSLSLPVDSILVDTLTIPAVEAEESPPLAHWFDSLLAVIPIDPVIGLNRRSTTRARLSRVR